MIAFYPPVSPSPPARLAHVESVKCCDCGNVVGAFRAYVVTQKGVVVEPTRCDGCHELHVLRSVRCNGVPCLIRRENQFGEYAYGEA